MSVVPSIYFPQLPIHKLYKLTSEVRRTFELKNKVSMSGGITQLVAVGAQDVHLVGKRS